MALGTTPLVVVSPIIALAFSFVPIWLPVVDRASPGVAFHAGRASSHPITRARKPPPSGSSQSDGPVANRRQQQLREDFHHATAEIRAPSRHNAPNRCVALAHRWTPCPCGPTVKTTAYLTSRSSTRLDDRLQPSRPGAHPAAQRSHSDEQAARPDAGAERAKRDQGVFQPPHRGCQYSGDRNWSGRLAAAGIVTAADVGALRTGAVGGSGQSPRPRRSATLQRWQAEVAAPAASSARPRPTRRNTRPRDSTPPAVICREVVSPAARRSPTTTPPARPLTAVASSTNSTTVNAAACRGRTGLAAAARRVQRLWPAASAERESAARRKLETVPSGSPRDLPAFRSSSPSSPRSPSPASSA